MQEGQRCSTGRCSTCTWRRITHRWPGATRGGWWHPAGSGGTAGAAAWCLTLDQLHGPLLASGAVTDEDLGATLALLDDPGFAFLSQVTVAAWGRRPAA